MRLRPVGADWGRLGPVGGPNVVNLRLNPAFLPPAISVPSFLTHLAYISLSRALSFFFFRSLSLRLSLSLYLSLFVARYRPCWGLQAISLSSAPPPWGDS